MKSIWGITDGSAGMVANVRAVLEALGLPYALKTCIRKAPWVWLPNDICGDTLAQLTAESDALAPPWPDLVVTCGRRSSPLSAAIRKASRGRTKAVHLQHPRMRLSAFDLIVPMEHDGQTPAPNVLATRFALHRITPGLLAEAGATWQARFDHLPKPCIAVLLGGSTRHYRLNAQRMRQVVAALKACRAQGSLLITPSRRTGGNNVSLLQTAFGGDETVYVYEGGENPYLGLLAVADYIVVTSDSVNMMTEAAATGKPLYILRLPGHRNTRPARFAEMLIAEGIARKLGEPWARWSYAIPAETALVAEAVRALLG